MKNKQNLKLLEFVGFFVSKQHNLIEISSKTLQIIHVELYKASETLQNHINGL